MVTDPIIPGATHRRTNTRCHAPADNPFSHTPVRRCAHPSPAAPGPIVRGTPAHPSPTSPMPPILTLAV